VLAERRVPRMFYDYADSGSYTEGTYRANEDDFSKIRRPRRGHSGGLHGVSLVRLFWRAGHPPRAGLLSIEDLRVLAERRVPRMFYDYADSGSYTEGTYRATRAFGWLAWRLARASVLARGSSSARGLIEPRASEKQTHERDAMQATRMPSSRPPSWTSRFFTGGPVTCGARVILRARAY
jgi:hypothetical protein